MQVTIVKAAVSGILLFSVVSCSSGSSGGKVSALSSSPVVTAQIQAMNQRLNTTSNYLLTASDLQTLQKANVLVDGDTKALSPLVK